MAKNPVMNGKAIVTIAVVSAITTVALGHLAAKKKA